MKDIYKSTNDEIIKEQIDLLKKFNQNYYNAPGLNEYKEFDISQYITNLRLKGLETTIDEIVEFFKLIGQREDIDIQYPFLDRGYELSIDTKQLTINVTKAQSFNNVIERPSFPALPVRPLR